MKNSYGNYVIQKALKLSNGHFKVKITNNIKKCLDKLTDAKLINKWKNILENMKANNLGTNLGSHKLDIQRKKSNESILSNGSNNSINSNNSFHSGNSYQSGNSFHSSNNENYIHKRNVQNFNFGNETFNKINSNNLSIFNNNFNFLGNIHNNNDINPLNNMILQKNNEFFSCQFNQTLSKSAENSPNMNNKNMQYHNLNRYYYNNGK